MRKIFIIMLCLLLALNSFALAEALLPRTPVTDEISYLFEISTIERTDDGLDIELEIQNLDIETIPLNDVLFGLAYADTEFSPLNNEEEITLLPLESQKIVLSYTVPEAAFSGDFGVFLFSITAKNGDQFALDVLDALDLAKEGTPNANLDGVQLLGELAVSLKNSEVIPAEQRSSLKHLLVTIGIQNNSEKTITEDDLPEASLTFRERYIFEPLESSDAVSIAPGEDGTLLYTFEVAKLVTESEDLVTVALTFHDETVQFPFIPGNGAAATDAVAPISVDAGYRHSLAVAEDGTTWAWGSGEYGRLGTGSSSTGYSVAPVELENVVSVSAGYYHSLFLTADGSVWAVGCNYDYGQLGDGSGSNQSIPVKVMDGAVQIFAGADYSLVIKDDATLWVWGRNDVGQLGLGDTKTRTTPEQVALENVESITGGEEFAIARTADGALYGWGNNTYTQLGETEEPFITEPLKLDMDSEVKAVAAGNNHVLALLDENQLVFWGDSAYDQLGGGTDAITAFLKTEDNPTISNIEAGGDMCAIQTENGSWYAWGDLFGSVPKKIEYPLVDNLSIGYWHVLGIQDSGTVWGYGSNDYSQIGYTYENTYKEWGETSLNLRESTTTTTTDIPKEKDKAISSDPFLASTQPITAGNYTSFAVDSSGAMWAWGRSDYGQLGAGEEERLDVPTKVSLKNVVQVAAGDYHTLFVTEDGSLYGAGCNYDYNQLGNGTYEDANEPVYIMNHVKRAWAGRDISAVLLEDGTLWTWGNNDEGQLGLGHTEKVEAPTQVDLEDIVDAAVGKHFMAALLADGTVWTWGSNAYGQLGIGEDDVQVGIPTKIALSGVISIAAGSNHMVALDSDTTVWCWGSGYYGQIGDGKDIDQRTPVEVELKTSLSEVYAGGDTTVAKAIDGSWIVWGAYFYSNPSSCMLRYYNAITKEYDTAELEYLSMGPYHILATDTDGNVYAVGDNSYHQLGVDSNSSSSYSYYAYYDWNPIGLSLEETDYIKPASTPKPSIDHQAL